MDSLKNSLLALQKSFFPLKAHYWKNLDSTQNKARELAAAGAASPFLVLANHQSAGRGRLNRRWDSPPGLGLYGTLFFTTALDLAKIPWITLAAGLALKASLAPLKLPELVLKWPNDLLSQGKKLAGILAESQPGPSGQSQVSLGFGLNVYQSLENFPLALQDQATSLQALGASTLDRGFLLKNFIQKILLEIKSLEDKSSPDLLKRWELESGLLGRQISFTWKDKKQNGEVLGLNAQGHLRVKKTDQEILTLVAEDSTLLKP